MNDAALNRKMRLVEYRYTESDVTNITQHVAYIPYGEVFVEERNGVWNTPYLFNAKELDEETGLYYYGARYLNPKDTRWISVDPLFEKYVGMSPYNYCAGNPVRLVDVDGREVGLDGEECAVNEYVKMLHDHTGNNYIVENGKLKNNGVDDSFKGKKSDKLAKSIDKAISSSTQYNLTIVSESDDVFIDSYESKQIDVSDLKKIGEGSSAFQAAAIGHFVNEIQYGNFQEGHHSSLNFESEVFSEISGELVYPRTDYQESSSNDGYIPVIYQYSNKIKFEIKQGASKTKVGETELIPGMKTPIYEQKLNGKIKSVKKK